MIKRKLEILLLLLIVSINGFSQYYSHESKDNYIRELFSTYSPNCNYMLDQLGDFNYLYYLKGNSNEKEILTSIEIFMHESTHALSSTHLFAKTKEFQTGNQLVSFDKIKPINNIFAKALLTSMGGVYSGDFDISTHPSSFECVYITDSISILMRKPKQFCENNINQLIPEEIRNEIYRIGYTQNCLGRGIFTYVNEFSAYYHGCKATIDISNYIIEKATTLNDGKYLLGLIRSLSTLDAYYEMKLFIAWHLLYAKNYEVETYGGLIQNMNLRVTYTLIDELYMNLLNKSQPLITKVEELYNGDLGDDISIKGYMFEMPALGPLKYIFDLPNTKTEYLKGLFTKEVIDILDEFAIADCNLNNYSEFLKNPLDKIIPENNTAVDTVNQITALYEKGSSLTNKIPIIYRDAPTLADYSKTKTQKQCIELLEKYSPECYSMVTDYYTLPRTVVCPETQWSLEEPIDIEDLVDKKNISSTMPWAMFSLCHKYTTIKGNIVAASDGQCAGIQEGFYTYSINPQKAITVHHTEVILTRKLANNVPNELRGQYFKSAMASSDKQLATQKYGIYGLVDEYNSFYYAMRLTIDMLELYKSEFGTNQQKWLQFFGRSEMIYSTYSEYKLYIMEYLKAIKQENPDMYDGITTNQQFKEAFFEIDKNWMIANKEYNQFKVQILKFLETSLTVSESQTAIQIGNMAIPTKREYVNKVDKYLSSDVYQAIYEDLDFAKTNITY